MSRAPGKPRFASMLPDSRPGPGITHVQSATHQVVAKLHWVFAGFSALNIVLLLNSSGSALLGWMALTGYTTAAILSGYLALRGPRRGRQLTIVLHLAMAPLQFVFSIPV